MKKILVLSLIFVFSLALSGCVKKATQPDSIDSDDLNQDENATDDSGSKTTTKKPSPDKNNPKVVDGDEEGDKDSNDDDEEETVVDLDITQEDLNKLKTDIQALDYEDLSAISE